MQNAAKCVLLIALGLGCLPAYAGPTPAEDKLDAQIARLIGQLGDNEYPLRTRAQQELLKLGVEAFDALSIAQNSDDIEVANQARYLVHLIRSDWTMEGDSQAVKDKLKDYEQKSDDERKLIMIELAQLSADDGIEALCRLVRFEESAVLSKEAAIDLLNQELPSELAADAPKGTTPWKHRADLITRTLGRSNRAAADWLRTYLVAHDDPEQGLKQWVQLTDAELKTLQQQPSQTHSRLVMQLLRRQVDLLDRLQRPDDALAAIRKMVQVEPGDPREPETLTELVKWLAQRKVWAVVDEVAARFAGNFDADALLLYTLAEARLEQGKKQLAEETAEKALKLNGEKIEDHFDTARSLQERGLEDWSDREFRRVIQLGQPSHPKVIAAQLMLSESLHDRELDGPAAKVLEPLVKAMESETDTRVALMVPRLGRNPDSIRSRMNFFFANDAAAAGKRDKQTAFLDTAIRQDPGDVDVLIALYHLPDQEPGRHANTMKLIKKAVDDSHKLIDDDMEDQNANMYNQVAWLVANTEGDFDEAIRCSQESVRINRMGGYLDTLGRCHFAKAESEKAKGNYSNATENYVNAVKYQSEAVKLEPHTRQIGRQLVVFRAALEKQNFEHPEAKSTKPPEAQPAPANAEPNRPLKRKANRR